MGLFKRSLSPKYRSPARQSSLRIYRRSFFRRWVAQAQRRRLGSTHFSTVVRLVPGGELLGSSSLLQSPPVAPLSPSSIVMADLSGRNLTGGSPRVEPASSESSFVDEDKSLSQPGEGKREGDERLAAPSAASPSSSSGSDDDYCRMFQLDSSSEVESEPLAAGANSPPSLPGASANASGASACAGDAALPEDDDQPDPADSAPDVPPVLPMATSNWPEGLQWLMSNLRVFLYIHERFRPGVLVSRHLPSSVRLQSFG